MHQYLARLSRVKPEKSECHKCGKIFTKVGNLRKHLNGICYAPLVRVKSKPEKSVKNECHKCGKIFTEAGNLRRHLKGICNEEREKIKCPKCGKALHEVSLKRHLEMCESRRKQKQEKLQKKEIKSKPNEIYKCEKCSYQTNKKGFFDRHLRLVHFDEIGFKQCEKCNAVIVEAEFEDHTCVLLPCDICGKGFCSQRSLEIHMDSIHDNKGLSTCETCGKLVRIGQMKVHMESHLPDQDLPCHICGKKLRSESSLRRHLHRHTIGKTVCTKCGKSVNNLKKHMMVAHTKDEDKKFPCPSCGKGFIDQHYLKAHELQVHNKTHFPEQEYPCHLCGKKLSSEMSLKSHLQRHSKEKTVCTICGNSVYDLDKHMKTMHSKEEDQEHKCQYCGKGFIDLHYLKVHENNVHTKINIEKKECPKCGKLFSRGNLSTHIKKIHGKESIIEDD